MVKNELTKKIICVIILIAIGCVSFFVAAPWAGDPANYENTTETLDNLENKAIIMTGTAAALATAAALVPGDATTPIANKLADVAGYMVIVYVAIILEKYLLTMTGFAAFKILVPAALLLIAVSILLTGTDGKIKLRKIACKFMVMSMLLWALIPTSAVVTNIINNTYNVSYDIEVDGETDAAQSSPAADSLQDSQSGADASEEADDEGFFKNLWNNIVEKTETVTDEVSSKITEGTVKFQQSLNKMLEGVAVMIVTTCLIPLCVLMLFLWIVKMVAGLDFSVPGFKKLPKASKLNKNTSE